MQADQWQYLIRISWFSSEFATSNNENLSCLVHVGDFILVKYKGKKFLKFIVGCLKGLDVDVKSLEIIGNFGKSLEISNLVYTI